jgi:hypothetical protein
MRTFLVALALVLAAAAAVNAQQAGKPKSLQNDGPQKDGPKTKADDKAYGNALGNLPDKAYDPWKGVR